MECNNCNEPSFNLERCEECGKLICPACAEVVDKARIQDDYGGAAPVKIIVCKSHLEKAGV